MVGSPGFAVVVFLAQTLGRDRIRSEACGQIVGIIERKYTLKTLKGLRLCPYPALCGKVDSLLGTRSSIPGSRSPHNRAIG